jgi:hypothetical protein
MLVFLVNLALMVYRDEMVHLVLVVFLVLRVKVADLVFLDYQAKPVSKVILVLTDDLVLMDNLALLE